MASGRYGRKSTKPYGFVDIEPLEPGDREHPIGHDRYHPETVNGQLKAALLVATPLHVASGRIGIREGNKLVKEFTRVNGEPCIPASTIKGIVRSVVEAITRSCIRIVSSGKWRRYRVKYPEGTKGCKDPRNLCLACRMFGSLGFEGHVRFDDAVLSEGSLAVADMPALWEPAKRGADPYLKGRYPKGRKFYKHGQPVTWSDTPVEVLMPESRLGLVIRFDNLKPGELGVLLTALGLGEAEFLLKLGGGKPACYGSVLARVDSLQVWEEASSLYTDYDIERASQSPDRFLQKASSLLLSDQIQQLVELWEYDQSRQCPEGNY